ncbi:MAG: hypothetical protein VX899_23985 [Myxococcota bacterium]|nr:hypothetical protein [Myxococcota bacterium]
MIDPRLGRILATLDFPIQGVWIQPPQSAKAHRAQLVLPELRLSLAHPGEDILEKDGQALQLQLPTLQRLCAAAAHLGLSDLAAPAAMVEALREAAGAHFEGVYVELEWDGQAWEMHQVKQVMDVAADSPALEDLNPKVHIPLFAAQEHFGADVQADDWVGFALDGQSSLVLRLLFEATA